MSSWDRQERVTAAVGRGARGAEPATAYAKFCIYRDLGPERALPRVGEICGISTSRCEQLCAKYGWVQRVDQWDAHVRAIQERAFLSAAAKRARQRSQAYDALLLKALEALKHVDVGAESGTTLPQIAVAMKAAIEGQRLEENLETQRSRVEVSDARAVLSQLPLEVRRELLRHMAARLAPVSAAPLGIPDDAE